MINLLNIHNTLKNSQNATAVDTEYVYIAVNDIYRLERMLVEDISTTLELMEDSNGTWYFVLVDNYDDNQPKIYTLIPFNGAWADDYLIKKQFGGEAKKIMKSELKGLKISDAIRDVYRKRIQVTINEYAAGTVVPIQLNDMPDSQQLLVSED